VTEPKGLGFCGTITLRGDGVAVDGGKFVRLRSPERFVSLSL
jgi:hypothetical protein